VCPPSPGPGYHSCTSPTQSPRRPHPSSESNPPIGDIITDCGAHYGPPVAGDPFVQGPGDASDIDPNDVRQGQLGDCYFLATLASIAQQDPERIRNMVEANSDGTYTVWFPSHHPATGGRIPVRVTADLPLDRDGNVAFARPMDFDPKAAPSCGSR